MSEFLLLELRAWGLLIVVIQLNLPGRRPPRRPKLARPRACRDEVVKAGSALKDRYLLSTRGGSGIDWSALLSIAFVMIEFVLDVKNCHRG